METQSIFRHWFVQEEGGKGALSPADTPVLYKSAALVYCAADTLEDSRELHSLVSLPPPPLLGPNFLFLFFFNEKKLSFPLIFLREKSILDKTDYIYRAIFHTSLI